MAATDHEDARLRSVALQNARSIVLARRRAEEVLRKQSEWLRVTLSSIGDGVISTDAEGRVSFMNGVAEALTGWTRNEAMGQALDAVFRIVNESTRERRGKSGYAGTARRRHCRAGEPYSPHCQRWHGTTDRRQCRADLQ